MTRLRKKALSGIGSLVWGMLLGIMGAIGGDLWQLARGWIGLNSLLWLALGFGALGVVLLAWDRMDKLELTEAENLLINSVKVDLANAQNFHITSSAFTTFQGVPATRHDGTFVVDKTVYELHGDIDRKRKEILRREWMKKTVP